MATKIVKGGTRKSAPAKARSAAANSANLMVSGDRAYTTAGLAAIGRRVVQEHQQLTERQQRQAAIDAGIERMDREGVTLKGERRDLAVRALYGITMSAAAVHQLAGDAGHHDANEAGWYLEAIDNMAIVIARRVDVVLKLLDGGVAGNFEGETDPDRAIARADEAQAEAES
jgi:hypothetical protein